MQVLGIKLDRNTLLKPIPQVNDKMNVDQSGFSKGMQDFCMANLRAKKRRREELVKFSFGKKG